MNWSDEKYVKVYTRDTLTWRSWGWQARTVFLHLARKLDGAGLIEVGRMDPVDALALQLDLPREVVAAGLPQILECGTAELVPAAVLVPNWVEAQEATKFEAAKKRDQRERAREQRRAAQVSEIRQAPVPARPSLSQPVPLQPSPAQPSPAQQQQEAAPAPPVPGPVEALRETWNREKPPECAAWKATPRSRLKAAKAALRDQPDLEVWRGAIRSLVEAPFVRGHNDRGWKGNPDWLLRDGTLTKILEGQHTGSAPPTKGRLAVATHGVGEVPLAF